MYNGTNFCTIVYYWLQISVENMESNFEGVRGGGNSELLNNKVTVNDGDKHRKRHWDRLYVQLDRMNKPQGQSNLPHADKDISLFMKLESR